MSDKATERLDHLNKREGALTRELVKQRTRITVLEKRVERLAVALQAGLPHMNLGDNL